MLMSESCPDCGAQKPSYLGGSHMHRPYGEVDAYPVCGGRPDAEYWLLQSPPSRVWPVA